MKAWAIIAAILLGMAWSTASRAADPELVPDVSQSDIEIQYSFTGEKLLLFGAILYPGGQLPDERTDIVVVLKGPSTPLLVREKRKVAGIWINADSVRLRSAPSFYAIGSSRPIGEIVDERTAAIYELGLNNLQLSPIGFETSQELNRFESGFIWLNQRKFLLSEEADAVSIREGVLYRATLDIPARVPVGRITAQTFLISNGEVVAVASREISVRKSGFERFVATAAQDYGFLYGLAAVLVSLLFGYLASLYFNRR